MAYKIKISIIYKDKILVRQSRVFNTRKAADKWFEEKMELFKTSPSQVLVNGYGYFENTELTMFQEDICFEND